MDQPADISSIPESGRRRLKRLYPQWPAIHVSMLYSILLFLGILMVWEMAGLTSHMSGKGGVLTQSAINPNTATWASLTRLPGIGPARATKIISYRRAFFRNHPGGEPFPNLQSMRKLKGFGPVTLSNLAPYLRFNPRE
ncbi:MAG: ComEA family DNA-binding protein [Phycisphaerae bacterium]